MADRSSSPSAGDAPALPPFEGAPTVLHLLDDMIAEPEWFRPRGNWPLLWLSCATPRRDLLKPLAARYHTVTPAAWVEGTDGPSRPTATDGSAGRRPGARRGGTGRAGRTDPADQDTGPEQPGPPTRDPDAVDPSGAIRLLRELVDGLRTGRPRVGDRSFRRFDFVYWLAHQRLPQDGRPARRELAVRHRRYLAGDPSAGDLGRTLPTDSWWSLPVRLVLAVLVSVGYGVITRLLPHCRWLRRQRYLNHPVSVTDVLDLAVRATQPHPRATQRAELEKLLVHALLVDLERRAPARWWPPVARRRARQPVLLFVDNLTDTRPADRLLRLIAAVRNETGEPDPVVVVVCARSPRRRTESVGGQVPPRTPRRAESWVRGLARRRRTSARAVDDPGRSEPPDLDGPGNPSTPGDPDGDDVADGSDPVRDRHEPADTAEPDAAGSLPPGRPEFGVELGRPGAASLLDAWRVRHRNTDHAERSWRLRLTVPRDAPPGQQADQLTAEIQAHRLPAPASLPTWSVAVAIAAAGSIVVGGLGLWWYTGAQERCGVVFPASDTRLEEGPNGHCIGITDLTDYTFTPPQNATFGQDNGTKEHGKLRRAQETIGKYNEQVEASGRPYVTVVYLGSIADRDAAGGTVAAPRAELEGLAIAQQNRIEEAEDASIPAKRPLLRVLVANAGPSMTEAPRVAELIDELYDSTLEDRPDPIVGVAGLGQSVEALEEAMRELQPTGLPLIGSVTSYDGLPAVSDNYFQVGPNNQRAARVAAYFAKQEYPGARELLVVRSSADNDTYSRDLAEEVRASFRDAYADTAGFTVRRVMYETSGSRHGLTMKKLGREICEQQGLVFFAGRAQELKNVAEHMGGCIRAGSQPPVLAGDDVSRAVLEGALDDSGLELTYVPLATSATDDRGNCAKRSPPSWMSVYQLNKKLFDGSCPDSSDGRMLLIYDAVQVLLDATDLVADTGDSMSAVSGPAVRTKVEDIRGTNAINGVSGLIDFGRNRDNRVPVNKAVSVLRIEDGDDEPELLLRCGPLYAGDTSSPRGCPR